VSRQASEKELATQVEKLATEVSAANEHISRLQAHAEWQQKEWDAAKRRVEELSQRTGRLEGNLEAERQRTVQLGADLQAAGAHVRQLQAHAEWLQTEWDAAKGELRAVYASKSWRITWPLRTTMQGIKWLLGLPALWQAKRPSYYACIAKPLVVWAMRKTLSNPRLKSRALHVLAQHPQLKQHLRQFVVRLGLMTDSGIASQSNHPLKPDSGLENTVAIAYPPNVQGKSVNNLSPRATRIYADLQKAIKAREN
jgi:hypothetical protein